MWPGLPIISGFAVAWHVATRPRGEWWNPPSNAVWRTSNIILFHGVLRRHRTSILRQFEGEAQ